MALGLAAPVAAQPPSPLPEAAAEVTEGGRYPAHEAAFPNGVRGLPGLVYREPLGYRALTLDLYLPPGSLERPAGGFPLVIYIHGGGWMGGDARSSGPFAGSPGVLASLAARGYVVASIAYRLSGEARFPAQAQDVKAAIRWLRLEAPRFGIDPARAVTWGVSAGGHLSGLAALGCKAAALEPGRAVESGAPDPGPDPIPGAQVSDCVQAGVAWYGVFDMATIAAQSRRHGAMSRDVPGAPEWRLLGCFGEECTPQQIAAASPVTYVDADDPPMLLIVGSADTTVPHQQTLEMAETLDAAGVEHELIVLPGLNHSFIGKTPEETREANRKALEATFRFIDRTIGRASTPSP
jgi:acetyl esterase/lipase